MGCGASSPAKKGTPPTAESFDPPAAAPFGQSLGTKLVAPSVMYCMAQHVSEWPDYYCLVDCRPRAAYSKNHINNAEAYEDVHPVPERLDEVTVILYGDGAPAKNALLVGFVDSMVRNKAAPAAIYVLDGSFKKFSKRYGLICTKSEATRNDQPGPLELMAPAGSQPGVYVVHRNQFQHCRTSIALLGCSIVVNLSARRLYLKTAVIKLENIRFDTAEEPYDDAIAALDRWLGHRPQRNRGHILLIDEIGCDYGALLIGWRWLRAGCSVEAVCEHLTLKMGELDPWYCDVLRAWADAEKGGAAG